MSNLDRKIADANAIIADVVRNSLKPIVACSFGKDSMMMLDLIRRAGHAFPILFYAEPFFPRKREFANRVIQAWDLTVYDYPPVSTAIAQVDARIEIMNYYLVGDQKTNRLPTGIYSPRNGEPYLCGYEDIYQKPLGGIRFAWDSLFIGHKSSDVDFLLGPVPISVDQYQIEDGPLCCFPVRHFTDEDIWEYTERFGVPYNEKRYDKASGYAEFTDFTYNNDWYPACTNCLDTSKPATVMCPKAGVEIENRSHSVRRSDVAPMRYFTGVA